MDVITIAFPYPRIASTSYSQPSFDPKGLVNNVSTSGGLQISSAHMQTIPADAETVQKVVTAAMQTHGCLVTCNKSMRGQGWNFHIRGSQQQVMAARGEILWGCSVQRRASIKVACTEILDLTPPNPTVKPEVRRALDEIASVTRTRIAVVNTPRQNNQYDGNWPQPDLESTCDLSIIGHGVDAIGIAMIRLLVMLDELSGLSSQTLDIDYKLHNIIAGRRRSLIQSIEEQTSTKIYLPSPLQGLSGPQVDLITQSTTNPSGSQDKRSNTAIWITGEFFGIREAKELLNQRLLQFNNTMTSRDVVILPRKLDWMLTERADDLRMIMNDNGTFIQFEAIGSSTGHIKIFGDSAANVQRTIRALMNLASQFYLAVLWLVPIQISALLPPLTINHAQISNVLQQISSASGSEVVFKGNCFEMHGLEHEVRAAITMILEVDIVHTFGHEIRFQLELANEHREFISGKKNGKINKIMQTTGVKIKFETYNDHNFLIDISSNNAGSGILQGLSQLQEELPAEMSFHVPEIYHKRIIGVGGKNIQKIMKKYGVYVKFSSAEESAVLGGYLDIEDNVVARTPAKNAMSLMSLKQAVMEMVVPKDRDFVYEQITIPRKHFRMLMGEKSSFIHDIETKTSCKFRFPDMETGSDIVSVFGPESQIPIAFNMLLDHVPFEAEMSVPPHKELGLACISQDFVAFRERLQRELQMSIQPVINPPGFLNSAPDSCTFKFICQSSNVKSLPAARDMLEQFLLSKDIPTYQSPALHKRADSFADAFPHFESKLLSHHSVGGSIDASSLGRSARINADRRLRLAASSPDVKALFNHPPGTPYIYNNNEAAYAPETDQVSDYWTYPQIASPPVATRTTEETLKRGSDPLLEAKLKDKLGKPRTQSLDLTLSLYRISETSSDRPESPTDLVTEEGGGGNNGTAPSYPSVYAPPQPSSLNPSASMLRPNANANGMARRARILDDDSVNEVSRVLSNFGL